MGLDEWVQRRQPDGDVWDSREHLHAPLHRTVPQPCVHNHLQKFDSWDGPSMNKRLLVMLGLAVLTLATASVGEQPRFKVLAFYSPRAEPDHVLFAESALKFFTECAAKDGFTFDATTDWANLNDEYLKPYQLVVWLNDSPGDAKQRRAFQHYMENGGAWLGFH